MMRRWVWRLTVLRMLAVAALVVNDLECDVNDDGGSDDGEDEICRLDRSVLDQASVLVALSSRCRFRTNVSEAFR